MRQQQKNNKVDKMYNPWRAVLKISEKNLSYEDKDNGAIVFGKDGEREWYFVSGSNCSCYDWTEQLKENDFEKITSIEMAEKLIQIVVGENYERIDNFKFEPTFYSPETNYEILDLLFSRMRKNGDLPDKENQNG